MKAFTQSAAAAGFTAILLLTGCAHHNQMATTTTNDTGRISADQAAQAGVIPGPVKVDSSGNVYTSSAAPGSGSPITGGTNTNVNNIPAKSTSSVAVTQTPIEPLVTTPVETPAPEPVVETTTTTTAPSMTSATEDETTTTTTSVKKTRHRRMAKD